MSDVCVVVLLKILQQTATQASILLTHMDRPEDNDDE